MSAATAPGPLLFDLGARGSVVLAGKDRAGFLQGLVTNDVKKLAPGTGCAAAFLTPKGKLLAICVVLCERDRLVLDAPPELAATVEELLKKFLVFSDVTVTNETGETSVLHLSGDADGHDRRETEDLLRRVIGFGAEASIPAEPHSHLTAQFTFKENPPAGAAGAGSPGGAAAGGAIPVTIVRENRTGVPGFDVRLPASMSKEILSSLVSAGAVPAPDEELERRRIRAGIPRWGAELTEAVLPDEAGLRERGFVSETKGCYVGQEIVARIKTYGHVNRHLVRLAVSGGVPAKGDRVFFEGEDCGAVTSATGGTAANAAVALAYVKRERALEGTALTISSLKENPPSLPAVVLPAASA